MECVSELRPLGGHRLFVRFGDGTAGEVDLARHVRFDGVFSPLLDPAVFAEATVDPAWGSVTWPGGADLCPDTVRSWLSEGRLGCAPVGRDCRVGRYAPSSQ